MTKVTDHKMSTLLGKLKQVWRINRDWTLGRVLQEVKTMCDNPSMDVDDLGDDMLEQGTDRYLVQERRDHVFRFEQADKESELENKPEVVDQPHVKTFKEMTPEEQKEFRINNLKKARAKRYANAQAKK